MADGGKMQIVKAVKAAKKARIALDGPAGSGKTWTALELAEGLRGDGRIGLVDTEKSSADLYADRYSFDTIKLDYFSPQNYIAAIEMFAAQGGYSVLIVDSWSHAWEGEGGALEMVDAEAAKNRGNSYVAWRSVTPLHNKMVAAILDFPGHVIVTMRTKMEYALDKDEKTGKTTPRKVGMAPIQRGGVEYEFDVVVDMDLEHNFIVSKTRLPVLDGKVIKCPTRKVGKGILDDLAGAKVEAAPVAPTPASQKATPPAEVPIDADLHEGSGDDPEDMVHSAGATCTAPTPAPESALYEIPAARKAQLEAAMRDQLGWKPAQGKKEFAGVTDEASDKALGVIIKTAMEAAQEERARQEAQAAADASDQDADDFAAAAAAAGCGTGSVSRMDGPEATVDSLEALDAESEDDSAGGEDAPLFNADGTPANAAAETWVPDAEPEPEPEVAPEPTPAPVAEVPATVETPAPAGDESPVDDWTDEDTAAAANVGTLRAWLHTHGSALAPLTQADCKALAGYGEVEWKDLTEDNRMVIVAAVKAKLAEGK